METSTKVMVGIGAVVAGAAGVALVAAFTKPKSGGLGGARFRAKKPAAIGCGKCGR
jgi:hypothetical protein